MKEMIVKFYEKYADYAYRVALVRTNNKADAEDLAQEVVLKIIRNHEILKELINKDESQAKGYLAKAVVNMTIEQYKKSSTRLKREKNYANSKMVAIDEPDAPNNSDNHKHAILNAIKDLPEKYQTIIMLKFYEGHSNTELSSILNLKEVSIRSLISRAIQKLKNQLAATSLTLSIASITYNLESTRLILAPSEFKAKVIQNIHNHYEAIPLSRWYAINYKLFSFILLAFITSFIILKYNFFYSEQEQVTNIQEKRQQSIPLDMGKKNLFSFDLNMKSVNSKEELTELVNSILDIKNNKHFLISYKKKGITTIGTNKQALELPYTLMYDKSFIIYCEADILSHVGPKWSSVGLNLKLFTPHLYRSNRFSNEGSVYSIKYTILNKTLFAESTLYEGMRSYKIDEGDFLKPIGLEANNAIIRRISLHEMTQEEIAQFKEKNASHIQVMDAYIENNKKSE